MIFTNRQKPEIIPPIYLNNAIIKQENSVRFLGVILDNKLKFNLHIDHICNKVSKSIGILYKLKNVTNQKCLTSMYYSLVYPYLSYCSLVWGKAYDIHLKPLEIQQKRCLRIMNYKPFLEHTEPLFYSNEILK